ncbi:hypothetical protein VPH35_088305 [Triticum aestivum]
MGTAVAHAALRCGIKFNPTPEEAIGFYLRRWVLRQQLPDTAGVIHEARVYASEPKDLAAAFPRVPTTHNRFFFTTCKRQKAGRGYRISRAAGAGAGGWASNGKKTVQNDAGETIGFLDTLRYAYKDTSKESDWLMEEYHICGLDQFAVDDKGEERVLCRVYVSPGSKPGSVTYQQSEAGDHLLLGPRQPQVIHKSALPRPQEARQPQVIQKPAPLCALDKRRVAVPATMMTTMPTQQAPKRPAQSIAEPPRPKRVRASAAVPAPAASAAMSAAVRQAIGGWNSPKRPSWYPSEPPAFLSAPPPQRHAAISPHKSDPALTKDMDDFARSLESDLEMAEDQSTIQQGGHESTIQEQAGDDELASGSESQPPEVDMSDLLSWFDSDADELAEAREHVQDEQEDQPEPARTLKGLVADERGDDVIAQDVFDALDSIGNGDGLISDGGDAEDWLTLPLSAYNGIMY